jgi:hypothetical protein
LECGDLSPLSANMPHDDRQERDRILAQVRRLPAARLAELKEWLRALECGDKSPLSPPLPSARYSTAESGNKLPHCKEEESGDLSPHSKGGNRQ